MSVEKARLARNSYDVYDSFSLCVIHWSNKHKLSKKYIFLVLDIHLYISMVNDSKQITIVFSLFENVHFCLMQMSTDKSNEVDKCSQKFSSKISRVN